MKRTLLAIAATTLMAISAHAQPGGWGPGMMDGYGSGPAWGGMMDSYGRGPGWHGMSDGYGRGPGWQGMMGRHMGFSLDYRSLKLSDEQRDKILAIERAASGKRWELMGRMREQGLRMHESDAAGKLDDEALRKNFLAMSEAHKAMFETSLQARKDIQAVLTPEQREQLGRRR
jgi:Spy/CpxP family protein refolding chaperone